MSGSAEAAREGQTSWLSASKSNAWTDLGLTLPLLLGYHLGVVLLDVRNAADLVTGELVALADRSLVVYWGLTLAIAAGLVGVLWVLGRGQAFDRKRLLFVAVEGVLYAMIMQLVASRVVGSMSLAAGATTAPGRSALWARVVMSLGAGFYEEVMFRVVLFGLGVLLISTFAGGVTKLLATGGWAVVASLVFAGWHYLGPLGDSFEPRSFVFRAVCGLVLCTIYRFRGFAPAVWTHALYDVWAMVLA